MFTDIFVGEHLNTDIFVGEHLNTDIFVGEHLNTGTCAHLNTCSPDFCVAEIDVIRHQKGDTYIREHMAT